MIQNFSNCYTSGDKVLVDGDGAKADQDGSYSWHCPGTLWPAESRTPGKYTKQWIQNDFLPNNYYLKKK